MRKKPIFNIDEKPAEEREAVESSVEKNRSKEKDRKTSFISKISLIWSILSALYMIVVTCVLVSKKWVTSTMSYVLIAVLALYIVIFVVLILFAFRDPKRSKKQVKVYKKTLGIFKAFINVAFIGLAIADAIAVAQSDGSGFIKIFFVVLTLIVAIIKLALKITLFTLKTVRKYRYKNYNVSIESFVDGKQQKKGTFVKLRERQYNKER